MKARSLLVRSPLSEGTAPLCAHPPRASKTLRPRRMLVALPSHIRSSVHPICVHLPTYPGNSSVPTRVFISSDVSATHAGTMTPWPPPVSFLESTPSTLPPSFRFGRDRCPPPQSRTSPRSVRPSRNSTTSFRNPGPPGQTPSPQTSPPARHHLAVSRASFQGQFPPLELGKPFAVGPPEGTRLSHPLVERRSQASWPRHVGLVSEFDEHSTWVESPRCMPCDASWMSAEMKPWRSVVTCSTSSTKKDSDMQSPWNP